MTEKTKIISIILAATFFIGYLSSSLAEDSKNSFHKWKDGVEKTNIKTKKESNYLSRFENQINFESSDIVNTDYNRDSLVDYLIRLKGDAPCDKNLCPTLLLIKQQDGPFLVYQGPNISGNSVAISKETGSSGLDKLVFLRGLPAYCTWEWEKGLQQDYPCTKGPSRKSSN